MANQQEVEIVSIEDLEFINEAQFSLTAATRGSHYFLSFNNSKKHFSYPGRLQIKQMWHEETRVRQNGHEETRDWVKLRVDVSANLDWFNVFTLKTTATAAEFRGRRRPRAFLSPIGRIDYEDHGVDQHFANIVDFAVMPGTQLTRNGEPFVFEVNGNHVVGYNQYTLTNVVFKIFKIYNHGQNSRVRFSIVSAEVVDRPTED